MDLTKFCVSATAHERTFKFQGEDCTLWFRELPAIEFRRFHLAEQSTDEQKQVESMAKLIAASACVDAKGKPAFTYAQALQLSASAANVLIGEVLAVNGFGKSGND